MEFYRVATADRGGHVPRATRSAPPRAEDAGSWSSFGCLQPFRCLQPQADVRHVRIGQHHLVKYHAAIGIDCAQGVYWQLEWLFLCSIHVDVPAEIDAIAMQLKSPHRRRSRGSLHPPVEVDPV